MTEKSWVPLTEAFNIVGEHVYGDAWTGEEVDYDPIRAALPPAEKMPLWGEIRGHLSDAPSSTAVEQPTAVDLVAMMVERHKKTFKVLISLFHDGSVPTELEIDGSDRKPIRQEAWPDPEAWRWPDEDDPDLDEFDRPGRFDQYRIFWFSIPAGVGLFKPADGRDASVLGRQYSDGALWHQFIDAEPKTVFVDRRSLKASLERAERNDQASPEASTRGLGEPADQVTREETILELGKTRSTKRPGRNRGDGEIDDSKHLEAMKVLIDNALPRRLAIWNAAGQVVPSAAGTGTEDSIRRRLDRKYRAKHAS